MAQTTDDTAHADCHGTRKTLSAALLAAGFAAYIAAILGSGDMFADLSAALILSFIAVNLRRATRIVQLFATASVLIAVAGWVGGTIGLAELSVAAGRVSFLTSILVALIFLRLVAQRDPAFAAAGACLANQPPSRRYVSLGVGGNLFGVLLNLGGLGLLIEMTLAGQRRLETTHAVSSAVHDIRERRIVTAIVRGFSTIAFWSPFGIALNTLLLILNDLHWADVAPWGIGFSFGFLALGAVMDVIERRIFPVFPRPVVVPPTPGDALGLWAVLAHLIGLATLVVAGDWLLPLRFQDVLVTIVPIYAVVWALFRFGPSGPTRLKGDFIANSTRYVNEVGVFALAGLIGALLVAMVPQQALDPLLLAVIDTGGPVALVLALAWATLALAMLGLHPIITVVILAEFMARTSLISDLATLLALLTGWTLTVCVAPLATTATYVGAILNRGPVTVSMIWNGAFGVVTFIASSGFLIAGITAGWF
ncbi:hypothetical protein ACOI1H_09880 [Loktanella sp. DJP18]|uniref:hypothetical protein n=1 Tax=Loktanella sp. DJP18 TaxID=3409788 RepID=UPI003BB63733